MDRKRFQFSLSSLLVLTTACAVLLSLVKTFPNAAAGLAAFSLWFGLNWAGPFLFFLGSLLVYHSELFFPDETRIARVCAPLAGILCIIAGIALIAWARGL